MRKCVLCHGIVNRKGNSALKLTLTISTRVLKVTSIAVRILFPQICYLNIHF